VDTIRNTSAVLDKTSRLFRTEIIDFSSFGLNVAPLMRVI